jgi:nitrite reductase (NADH) large subunit
MEKQHLIIIGNGMAASRLLAGIVASGCDRYRISVFDQEPHGSYNRIMLSPVLADETKPESIVLHPPGWYSDNGITLYSNNAAVAIDRQAKTVTSSNGNILAFDKLVIATGSDPLLPSALEDCALAGIESFRNMRDVHNIKAQATRSKHALVIGGGLLGLEAAYGLRCQGVAVTVLHRGHWLLNRQLDETAGELLKTELERRGIKLILGAELDAVAGNGQIESATLSDGTTLSIDQLVVAIGISPNTTLAQDAGLDCERGILVDERMCTSHPDIYALGECCQFGRDTFGLVAPIWDQTEVLVDQLCAAGSARYRVQPTATKLKVSGIDLYSAGEYMDSADTEAKVFYDRQLGTYKKLLFRNEHLVGAVLYGAVQDGNWYFDLIQQQQAITPLRPHIIFGREYSEQRAARDFVPATTPNIAAAAPTYAASATV